MTEFKIPTIDSGYYKRTILILESYMRYDDIEILKLTGHIPQTVNDFTLRHFHIQPILCGTFAKICHPASFLAGLKEQADRFNLTEEEYINCYESDLKKILELDEKEIGGSILATPYNSIGELLHIRHQLNKFDFNGSYAEFNINLFYKNSLDILKFLIEHLPIRSIYNFAKMKHKQLFGDLVKSE